MVLAIETSTEIGSIALVQGEAVLAEAHHAGGPELSGWLLPAIERLLGDCRLMRADAVACGIGPGAFTGVRTACATAQALAWGWSVPLHAGCSLEAFLLTHFALSFADAKPPTMGRWAVLMDARQNETYAAVWEVSDRSPEVACPCPGVEAEQSGTGALRQVVPPVLVADRALAAWLAEHRVVQVLGSACPKLGALEQPLAPAIELEAVLRHAARGVARLAQRAGTEVDPLALEPLYVRDRVALTEAERAAARAASAGAAAGVA
ncbi:MAG: tRNA (adenosine(37)-N6)-threonylcarbamoyltransferase complex dimerization subunit type 1 TsaB [Casimicrobiaceae bacterium]